MISYCQIETDQHSLLHVRSKEYCRTNGYSEYPGVECTQMQKYMHVCVCMCRLKICCFYFLYFYLFMYCLQPFHANVIGSFLLAAWLEKMA